jgi:Tol biopolymer transport system component
MTRTFAVLAVVCGLLGVRLGGSVANDPLQEAHVAWERGDYVAALKGYLAILNSPAAESALEAIALQTGELYETIELTTDGTAPRFSPDGRHITYETVTTAGRLVRVVGTGNPGQVTVEVRGSGASFSPDSTQLVYLKPTNALIVIRDLATGRETEIDTGGMGKGSPSIVSGNAILFAGGAAKEPAQVHLVTPGSAPRALTDGDTEKTIVDVNADGTAAIVGIRPPAPGGRGPAGTPPSFGLVALPAGEFTIVEGSAPAFSADGKSLAYVARADGEWQLIVAPTATPSQRSVVRKGPERIDSPALSRDGSRVAFQMMPREDWELFAIERDGSGERRVTREIQHDLLPRFLTQERLLGVIGEARHRRSYVYDLTSGQRTRLFHNNTVRTIAPEYIWIPNVDGTRILISAERDGDTVSPARGVYLVDLSRRVSVRALESRLASNLKGEEALISKGSRLYAPIATAVKAVVGDASIDRVFAYEKALYAFDSKHISQPGNRRAGAYVFDTYKSFGYEPQYQWFDSRSALGGQTANVLATLKGTINPELVYVVSSHYDSVAAGPGADDDSSGTAALLEAARILAKHPQPATIVFASFTGEESGLLGSREFVRRAVADKVRVVGALNNDMIGWANDQRLDNTIRYSNPGIRDIQHAAAMGFTNLITYDALYYKGTDAAAYYEAYGDIVGGIGSYPVLGNPHYHQPHDVLETVNHRLVTEVAKTTAATLMLLASSPSRLTDLTLDRYEDGTATLSWRPSPEAGVTGYIVAYGPPDNPEAQQMTVRSASASVKTPAGSVVSVKAVNAKGLEGWDWARLRIRHD